MEFEIRTSVASFELARTAEDRVFFVSPVKYLTSRWESSPLDDERKLMTLLGDGVVMICDVLFRCELSKL